MAIMYCILRRNLISLSLKHNPNPCPFIFKTYLSSSFSSSSAAAGEEKRVTIAEYLQQRHQFPPDAVSKLVSSGKYLKDPEECDSVLSFFMEIGFSTAHLQKMIKRHPNVIWGKLDLTVKPKINLLQDAGLSPAEVADIVSASPWILSCAAGRIAGTISQLMRVLGPSQGLFRLLKNCNSTWFLTRELAPNLELFLSLGISSSQIASLMHSCPRFFFQSHEHIKKCVERAEEMGCDRSSNMFLYAIRTIGSMSVENWERKLELFRSLGFSEDDMTSVFKRAPQVFIISDRKIKESTRVLLSARNDDISLIVNYPRLLIYSVEKTLKPRLQVLEVLERKNLLVKKPRLINFIGLSNDDFLKKFVLPYFAEVGSIYSPKKALGET